MEATLAIEGAAGTSVGADSLPYLDSLSDATREAAEAMIADEMQRTKRSGRRPNDIVSHLKPISEFLTFKEHPVLQGEMARIQKGQKHMQPLDISRANLDTPRLHDQQSLAAWQASASNAAAQLEHQHTRICNFKLGTKYGPAVWRAHNARTTVICKHLDRDLKSVEQQIEAVNKRRKLRQEAAGPELERLWAEYQSLLQKNVEIEIACQPLLAESAPHERGQGGDASAAELAAVTEPGGAQSGGDASA